jgi:hypothetical protein
MSYPVDSKGHGADMESKGHQTQVEHVYDADEKARAADMKADAIEAENAEHNLGVIAAIKGYPMAATWAFVISCTIVSCLTSTVVTIPLLTTYQDHGGLLCFPHGKLHCPTRICEQIRCLRRRNWGDGH